MKGLNNSKLIVTADRLSESRKPCLNLWSRRWLNPRRNLAMCLIPLLLKQLNVLPGEGLINCIILFLKVFRLFFELRIDICTLFYSIIAERKKVIFEKTKANTGYINGWSFDAWAGLQRKQVVEITRILIFIYLAEGAQFVKPTLLLVRFET